MNNVYVRSKNSLQSIILKTIISLIPLILFGVYYNGYLVKKYVGGGVITVLKPLTYVLIGVVIGALVNIIFTKKTKNTRVSDLLFSSFHILYGIVLGALMSYSVNIIIYTIVITLLFILSKLVDIKINVVALAFIIIYIITNVMGEFDYSYFDDVIKHVTQGNVKDMLIGFGHGGLCATSLILILISNVYLQVTSSIKTNIFIYSFLSFFALMLVSDLAGVEGLFTYISSVPFIFLYVATDSMSSCYTLKGTAIYGLIIGIGTFILYFINPVLAPFIAILVASFFHVLIDKLANKQRSKK